MRRFQSPIEIGEVLRRKLFRQNAFVDEFALRETRQIGPVETAKMVEEADVQEIELVDVVILARLQRNSGTVAMIGGREESGFDEQIQRLFHIMGSVAAGDFGEFIFFADDFWNDRDNFLEQLSFMTRMAVF